MRVVTPNYLCFDYIMILKKMEKNYEDINTTVSFSVLRSTGYLLLIIAHKRMYLLSINTKEGGTQKTRHAPCSLVVYIFLVILFSFVIGLPSVTTYRAIVSFDSSFYSIILRQIIDIVMTS